LSLNNTELYEGCEIQEVAGRPALLTPISEAVNVVGRNAKKIVDDLVLVTGNTFHYQRIQALGYPLQLDNWKE
ncbi:MAG: hypothetical protein ACREBC_06050, partial [Pyrinomonadaceae bacterium]